MSIYTNGYILITGLSTDTKPTSNVLIGSNFLEIDTNKRYTWKKISNVEQWIQEVEDEDIQNSETLTYTELKAKITASSLDVGKMYIISDFKTIYEQPTTGIISTSVQGIANGLDTAVEQIGCIAISNNVLHYECVSITHPTDLLYYNHTQETLSDTITTTRGKIERRVDRIHNIDCDYDFRAYKFVRYAIDQNTTTNPNTLGGQYKDGNIHKVSIVGKVDTSSDVVNVYDETNFKHVLANDYTFTLCNFTKDLTDTTNVYTFHNPDYPTDAMGNGLFTDIRINGLNNIIVSKSTTKNITLNNVTNTSLISNVNGFSVSNVDIINTTNTSIVNCSNVKFGGVGQSSNNFINGLTNSSIGSHSTLGVNSILCCSNESSTIDSCILKNISNTEILHKISDVTLDLLNTSKIYNTFRKVVAFDLSQSNFYGICDNVIFNGAVTNLTVNDFGTMLKNSVFESDVNNLTLNSTNIIVDGCVFDKDVINVIIDSLLIRDTTFLCRIADVTISNLQFDNCNVTIGKYDAVIEPSSILLLENRNINIYSTSGANKVLVYKHMLSSGVEETIMIK